MRRKILGTFFSRVIVGLSSLIVLIITSRILGPEVRGTISLILIAMTITTLINEIVAGPALVYFFPRTGRNMLFRYASIWVLTCSLIVPFILTFLKLLPDAFLPWVIMITIFQATSGITMLYQLGNESAKRFNFLAVLQASMNPLILLVLIYVFNIRSIQAWLTSVSIAYGITALAGIYFVKKHSGISAVSPDLRLRTIISYGFLAQLSTLAYILSTRIPYYFLDTAESRASVGVFSTAVSFTEAALLFSSSVAVMTYSRIANSEDESYNLRITKTLSKLTFLITLPFMAILVILPDAVFTNILGDGFKGVQNIILFLFPGVSVISMSTIFTHYFSGKALYKVNAYASLTGLIVSLSLAGLIIPAWGIKGAAITTSMGYICSGVFTILSFRNRNKGTAGNLLPDISDIKLLIQQTFKK